MGWVVVGQSSRGDMAVRLSCVAATSGLAIDESIDFRCMKRIPMVAVDSFLEEWWPRSLAACGGVAVPDCDMVMGPVVDGWRGDEPGVSSDPRTQTHHDDAATVQPQRRHAGLPLVVRAHGSTARRGVRGDGGLPEGGGASLATPGWQCDGGHADLPRDETGPSAHGPIER